MKNAGNTGKVGKYMFGLNDDNQKSNDDPAMLDNVKQLASEPASQVEPQQTTLPSTQAGTDATDSSSVPPAQMFSPSSPVQSTPSTADTNDHVGHAEPAEGFSSQPLPTKTPDTPAADENQTTGGSTPAELFGNQSSAPTSDNADVATSDDTPVIQSTSTPAEPQLSEPTQNDVTAPPYPVASAQTTDDSIDTSTPTPEINHEQLSSLKQEALGHLEGLSEHLGDNPEEVFKTTMQLIQANDNHTLLEKALKAAKEIKDDKVRAQAMLDIVNEINYFSQGK